MINKKKKGYNRDCQNKVDHILEDLGKGYQISREIYLFYYWCISKEHNGRSINWVGKPLPGEKSCDKEKGIIFYLYFHNYFEGYEEYKGKG